MTGEGEMEKLPIKMNIRQTAWTLLMACSAAWAMQFQYGLAAADRGQGLMDLLLTGGLFLLLYYFRSRPLARKTRVRAAVLSALFVFLLAIGGDWFSEMRYGKFTNLGLYLLYYTNGLAGTYLLLYYSLGYAMDSLANASPLYREDERPVDEKKAFILTLILCLCVYFIFLLNQYPGSMESDHMRQLQHLLDGVFENQNPLVNSLMVWGCVRLVSALGGSMNGGIFLYSIVQLTLLSLAFAYGVALLCRSGFKKWVLIASALFYALTPYHIFYSYGMWKDTFFAICLLFTLFKLWSILLMIKERKKPRALDWVLLGIAALLCSLARNSGWSALLVLGACLPFLLRGNPARWPATGCLLGGVAVALVLTGPVFGALGVAPTADSITASCIPLQQIGQVISEEKTLSSEEEALLDGVVDRERVKTTFDPTCADPMKDAVYPRMDYLNEHLREYVRLWFKLGVKYPLTYLRAYKNLLRMYYDPNVSSEVAYKWIYQNDFGVTREPKLLPQLDFGYYETVLELPAINLLKRPGAMLWAMLLLWQVYALRNNRRARVFCIPLLAVFGGLFLTAPVALFRYVYSVAACLPLLFCWPYVKLEP
jgi:hypothetical protein